MVLDPNVSHSVSKSAHSVTTFLSRESAYLTHWSLGGNVKDKEVMLFDIWMIDSEGWHPARKSWPFCVESACCPRVSGHSCSLPQSKDVRHGGG